MAKRKLKLPNQLGNKTQITSANSFSAYKFTKVTRGQNMKRSHLLTFLLLVASIVLGITGVMETKAVLFLIVIFGFTSAIAGFSDRYRNK